MVNSITSTLTLLQFECVHLYAHMSPMHLSTSLGFANILQLLSSSLFLQAFKQVTSLLLSPSPQDLEHYTNVANVPGNVCEIVKLYHIYKLPKLKTI